MPRTGAAFKRGPDCENGFTIPLPKLDRLPPLSEAWKVYRTVDTGADCSVAVFMHNMGRLPETVYERSQAPPFIRLSGHGGNLCAVCFGTFRVCTSVTALVDHLWGANPAVLKIMTLMYSSPLSHCSLSVCPELTRFSCILAWQVNLRPHNHTHTHTHRLD